MAETYTQKQTQSEVKQLPMPRPDPDFYKVYEATTQHLGVPKLPTAPLGDIATRRQVLQQALSGMFAKYPPNEDVKITEFKVPVTLAGSERGNPAEVVAKWFIPPGLESSHVNGTEGEVQGQSQTQTQTGSGPAVLYMHGGGFFGGSVDLFEPLIRAYVKASGVPFLAVEYRLAPEYPYPIPVTDCYDTLVWMVRDVEKGSQGELAKAADGYLIDLDKIILVGASAGGNLAASVAIMAEEKREPGVKVRKQVLIYPMLDHRSTAR
jgi:acetyl esterase/lipase